MAQINCLIVDDEPLARELLAGFCAHLPQLHVVALCGNALEARQVLQEQAIDLLFLDINMPLLDGISFLNTLRNRPQVIMTTAYKEYAVDAFDLAVCDYLVKPFSLDRFIIAVDRATAGINTTAGHLFIKADGKIYRINFSDLLYIEASGNNTQIITTDTTLLPALPFSAVEKMLPTGRFLKTHRSFILNKDKIGRIEGNRVFIGTLEIPIGRNYRDGFLRQLGLS